VRGHRLVADDVIVDPPPRPSAVGARAASSAITWRSAGLGIINIKTCSASRPVREGKVVELVVEMHEWDANVERRPPLGVDDLIEKLLDVSVPKCGCRCGRAATSRR
jgi:HPr kinase/phosphorylase